MLRLAYHAVVISRQILSVWPEVIFWVIWPQALLLTGFWAFIPYQVWQKLLYVGPETPQFELLSNQVLAHTSGSLCTARTKLACINSRYMAASSEWRDCLATVLLSSYFTIAWDAKVQLEKNTSADGFHGLLLFPVSLKLFLGHFFFLPYGAFCQVFLSKAPLFCRALLLHDLSTSLEAVNLTKLHWQLNRWLNMKIKN